ncbi:hypothetical protein AB0B48_32530, partial [Micromonospora sp. NPDC049089]|uniref:hypothetical protein n=1 Tax=Micromonospora sp. NPDC049089 TaxID=3155496 RepID=UPI0033E2ED7D
MPSTETVPVVADKADVRRLPDSTLPGRLGPHHERHRLRIGAEARTGRSDRRPRRRRGEHPDARTVVTYRTPSST